MGFLEAAIWRLLNSPTKDPFVEKSSMEPGTPSQLSIFKFPIPIGHSSSASSSISSQSSSSTFWQSPKTPSRWSSTKYIPSGFRNTVSKRQLAVLFCLTIAILILFVPSPVPWRRQIIHVELLGPPSSPYQVLRPVSPKANENAPDPLRWLEHNSNNRHSVTSELARTHAGSLFTQASTKPKAALISLVRNSELVGMMQSMRQLEYQWNRKYQYPWIFFNDEPFSDEFKVRTLSNWDTPD